jgi:translation initiation factor 3 subunit H
MADIPFDAVQISALTVMKIIKHASQMHPTTATGSLVGMEINGLLEITNSFPFPLIDVPSNDNNQQESQSNIAAAMPRAKQNTGYQAEMIKMLREVNVDANNVGWYTSTNMGNFINGHTIENQFFYQKEPNERSVALVYDTSRSTQGSLALRAFRLSPAFVTSYKEGKFTIER